MCSFKRSALALLIAAFSSVCALPERAVAEEQCGAQKCHQGLLKKKHIHPGTEDCRICHLRTSERHPQKNRKSFQLTQEVPELCNQCHSAIGTQAVVHAPVAAGMCASCHTIHAGQPKLLSGPAGDLCRQCHKDKVEFQFVHGPAATGDCTSCHRPHDSGNKLLLVKEGQDLCFSCHTEMVQKIKKKVVHQPLAAGCTSCHNPHGSGAKLFLPAQGPALCYQCHADIGSSLQSAKSIHAPIVKERGCASCHDPHSAETEKLLPKSGKELCLDCHKDLIKKNQTVLHAPIRAGSCKACHDPHGTANASLLSKPYTQELYVSYSGKEFEFCFSCHSRDKLRNEMTSYATGFRDGERNLHFLHVNREKGRNCKLCHVIHAGELPKLLADSVAFGKWNLPLNFEKTENGGSCLPGCHKKFSYDRKNPGKKPESAGRKATSESKRKSR